MCPLRISTTWDLGVVSGAKRTPTKTINKDLQQKKNNTYNRCTIRVRPETVSSITPPFQSRNDKPFVALSDVFYNTLQLCLPWAPHAFCVHLIYRLDLQPAGRYNLLEEKSDLQTTSVKARYAEDASFGRE
jgi:hypothetical protein